MPVRNPRFCKFLLDDYAVLKAEIAALSAMSEAVQENGLRGLVADTDEGQKWLEKSIETIRESAVKVGKIKEEFALLCATQPIA